MQDPQFVPARNAAPISPAFVTRRSAMARCSILRPTAKQAQTIRSASAGGLPAAAFPARTPIRAAPSTVVPLGHGWPLATPRIPWRQETAL